MVKYIRLSEQSIHIIDQIILNININIIKQDITIQIWINTQLKSPIQSTHEFSKIKS